MLTCHVLHEASKGAASLWAPYIAMLPRAYDLLESWSDQEAAELQARGLPRRLGSKMCADVLQQESRGWWARDEAHLHLIKRSF